MCRRVRMTLESLSRTVGKALRCPLVGSGVNGTVINGTRYPFGNQFGSNGYFTTMGNSVYNSLQVSLRHRSGPLELLAGYTWSKSIDNSSDFTANSRLAGWSGDIRRLTMRIRLFARPIAARIKDGRWRSWLQSPR